MILIATPTFLWFELWTKQKGWIIRAFLCVTVSEPLQGSTKHESGAYIRAWYDTLEQGCSSPPSLFIQGRFDWLIRFPWIDNRRPSKPNRCSYLVQLLTHSTANLPKIQSRKHVTLIETNHIKYQISFFNQKPHIRSKITPIKIKPSFHSVH